MNEKWEVSGDPPPEPNDPHEAPKGAFSSPAKPLPERVNDAIEAWYARHFHAAAIAGRQPITSEEKAALVEGITAAINEE